MLRHIKIDHCFPTILTFFLPIGEVKWGIPTFPELLRSPSGESTTNSFPWQPMHF